MKEKTVKSKKIIKNKKDDLTSALTKKALGYDYKEVVEEYVSGDDGEVKLTKKKVTKKNVPPDITAIKMLLEKQVDIPSMSDEELEKERVRLIKLLEQIKEEK